MEPSGEDRILSGVAHLVILLGWVGLALNVVLLVLYRPKSAFVAGHALQAIGLQMAAQLFNLLFVLYFGATAAHGTSLPTVGLALYIFLGLAVLVLAAQGAVAGFQGEEHRYPLIGELLARFGP